MNADCGRLHVETAFGIAESPMPGRSVAITVNRSASHWNARPPHHEVSSLSVHQDERWAVAGVSNAGLTPIDLGGARGDVRRPRNPSRE